MSEEAGTGQVRDVPVDWEALEDAFENNAPEVHSYLHLATGEVLRVVDGIADPEMHTRIASDANYLRVEPVSSREQYRWMERFIVLVEVPDLRERLNQAIDGKGAFRRFKDVLMSHGPERERWFAFRSERLRVFMEAWLATHSLRPVARPTWVGEPEQEQEPESAGISQEMLAGRRTRSADALRRELKEIIDALGTRDLEKVAAFAEFIKARRAARGFVPRAAAGEEADATTPSPAIAAAKRDPDEEPTPSSRKRTAAR
jgi:hypothetical protein